MSNQLLRALPARLKEQEIERGKGLSAKRRKNLVWQTVSPGVVDISVDLQPCLQLVLTFTLDDQIMNDQAKQINHNKGTSLILQVH